MAKKTVPTIVATGSYVPERIVTNAEIDQLLGVTTDQWLRENVGITERRWMNDDQVTSDLVVAACRAALEKANLTPDDLDLLIVSTDTPDYLSPSTSIVVQHKLGAHQAGCYDINSACAGWVTALDQGARYLMTEENARYVLVAGGYGMSRYLDLNDKTTANLFADGAGAAILGRGPTPGFLASSLLAKGEYHDALGIYSGGTFQPATPENLAPYGKPVVKFVKKFPKTFNTEHWPKLIQNALDKVGLGFDDVDHYYLTQLNLRTIESMLELMGQPITKTHWIMDKYGYTGSPCVVMALDDALAQGKGPAAGDVIVFCASGGGISMAVSVWKWTM